MKSDFENRMSSRCRKNLKRGDYTALQPSERSNLDNIRVSKAFHEQLDKRPSEFTYRGNEPEEQCTGEVHFRSKAY